MPDDLKANQQENLERLRKQIERLPDQPSGLLDLGRSLVGRNFFNERDCDACQQALPEYIEAELNGQPLRQLYPETARHLDFCPDCGQMYADLLEMAIQVEEESPTIFTSMPALDLSFLPPLVFPEKLRQVVEKLSKEMVDRLIPEFQASFASASQSFFRQVKELGPKLQLKIGQQYALAFGDQIPPPLQSIAAVYAATESIVNTLTVDELTEELSGVRPPRLLKKRARSSARAMGLGGKEAKQWVEQYILLAQENAADILELARRAAGNER
ncbi:MAG: zf-HC2 domain-containing protein [Anaerolineales bacterium]|nr:zf-HC2 domain-containing protein [Anaerolineales bacterium]